MSRALLGVAVAVLLAVVLFQTVALWQTAEPPSAPAERADTETVSKKLEAFGPIESLTFDQELGLFRAAVASQVVYITADGQYLMAGDLYDLESQENVTETARAAMRRETLAKLDTDSTITYSPEGETKASVWVFTDITCPYCQRFHKQIDAYTSRGIEVHYLAYPRSGPGSEAWREAEAVWCADDRHAALTAAKSQQAVERPDNCDGSAIADHHEAGQAAGLRGTPMIIDEDGRQLGGYVSPQQLASRLGLSG